MCAIRDCRRPAERLCAWGATHAEILRAFASRVQDEAGGIRGVVRAAWREQRISQAAEAPWGRACWKVVSDDRGDTFCRSYTVRLAGRVCVFQKKSPRCIAMPLLEIGLIKRRLKVVVAIAEARK